MPPILFLANAAIDQRSCNMLRHHEFQHWLCLASSKTLANGYVRLFRRNLPLIRLPRYFAIWVVGAGKSHVTCPDGLHGGSQSYGSRDILNAGESYFYS